MKNLLRVCLSSALIASGLTFAFVSKTETKVEAANPNKITICHRTAAVNNPYRRITVNKTAIADDITSETPPAGKRGHGQWSHNLWPSQLGTTVNTRPVPNVFNPTWKSSYYQTATQKRWGDIIPLTLDNGTNHNAAAMGLNFTNEGLAIYNGTTFGGVNYGGLCGRLTAAKYCDSLIKEGGTLAECQDELEEMGALEDEELKKTCGTNFEGCTLEKMAVINVRTVSVECAANVPTFNGSVATGTVAHNVSFEYGTDEFLTGATSIAATPASVTGSGTFAATVSAGLADGTYYYRAVAIDPANEGRLDGSISSFTVTNAVCGGFTAGDPEVQQTADPEPTTTTTTTTVAPQKGALKGSVWIDQNRNGKKDSNEPGLPNTPVVVEIEKPGTSSKSPANATTDANGLFNIPEIDPGTWTVSASLQSSALEKTFDSTNGTTATWIAKAVVPVNGIGEAEFAAAGKSQLGLDIEPTTACAKASSIEVQWAGADAKMNSTDDVIFTSSVKNQASLLKGLPWGNYLVTPICSDGTSLASQKLTISKTKTMSKMSVKLTPLSGPVAAKSLPATGQSSGSTSTALSVLLILAGVALLAAPRRRRTF